MHLRLRPALTLTLKQLVRKRLNVIAAVGATALAFLPQSSSAQNYQTSWFGNTFSGTTSQATQNAVTGGLHVQTDIYAMCVGSDGTCYTNSIWDEADEEAGIYKNGQVVGNCNNLHGWGRGGGTAIAIDANYVYVAISQNGDDGGNTGANGYGQTITPAPNTVWYCVRRYNLNGTPVSAQGGYGYDGSMLKVTEEVAPYSGKGVSGIAVDGTYLYVSDPLDNQIKKYSLSTLSSTPVLTWNVTNPGPISYCNGSLYVIQNGPKLDQPIVPNGPNPKILQFSTTGGAGSTITFASGVQPTGLASTTVNGVSTLLVTDRGPDQDVKEYNVTALSGSPTTVTSVFGTVGGIFAGSGAQIGVTGPRRLNNPNGVGVDASGNIYVAQDATCGGGGTVLESYNSSGSLNWQLLGLEFLDCADIDSASENDVYTKEEHFVMNYANTTPGTEASYRGYTVNPIKYPQDARLHLGLGHEDSAWVREYQGHKFLVTNDQNCGFLVISRFNSSTDGECAIPSTVFSESHEKTDSTGWPENQPMDGEWIWRDGSDGSVPNGTMEKYEYQTQSANLPQMWGYWVDSNMDVWEATTGNGIRHFVCQGLDSYGNPKYDYTHMTTIGMPSQFTDLRRIEYYPATDTAYLSGYNNTYPNKLNDFGGSGRVYCRYDNWSTTRTVHSGYPIVPAFDPELDSHNSDLSKGHPTSNFATEAAMSVAGQYLFITYYNQTQILVYDTNTGVQSGIITPGASVGAASPYRNRLILGDVDIRYGVRAYQRANGEYDIFNEDDALGKVVMYRWSPAYQVDDNASGWSYSGWALVANGNNGRTNNTWHETNTLGASAQYTFTGTSVNLIGEKQPYGGTATITIDGVSQGSVSYYAAGGTLQQTIFQASGLTPGTHTLRVVNNGNGWTYVDELTYIPCPAYIDDNASGWSYSGWTLQGFQYSGRTNDTWHESNTSGATAQYTFTGTSVTLIGEKQNYGGSATISIDGVAQPTISIDGVPQGSVDCWAVTGVLQQTIFEAYGLAPGTHTLGVTNYGNGWTYVDEISAL